MREFQVILYCVMIGLICACIGVPVLGQPIKVPVTITSPGSYELTEDAKDISDIYAIKIECSDVTIDGAGHFVTGLSRENSEAVYVNKYGSEVTNITLKNLKIDNWETGIHYNYVKGKIGDTNSIQNCEVMKSGTGVHIEYSDNVNLASDTITGCGTGVIVDQLSTHTKFKDNTFKDNQQGISITRADQTELVKNNINTCEVYGVDITDAEGSIVTDNSISDNKYAALKVESSKDTIIIGNVLSKTGTGAALVLANEVHNATIYNNYLESFQDVNVDDISSDIVWNTTLKLGTNILGGPYLGGNYWGGTGGNTGYSESAKDTAGYGICDKPYTINSYNIDYLPLHRTEAKTAPDPMATATPAATPASENVTANQTNLTPGSNASVQIGPEGNVTVPAVAAPVPMANTTKETSAPAVNGSGNTSPSVNTESPVPSANASKNGSVSLSGNVSPANLSNHSSSNPEASGLNISVTNAYHPNGTTPLPSIGNLVFTSNQDGASVSLKTSSGSYVTLDPLKNKTLTVAVPTDTQLYTGYKVTLNGYKTIEEPITQYPKAGENIPITLSLEAAAVQNKADLTITPANLTIEPVKAENTSGINPICLINTTKAAAVISNTTNHTHVTPADNMSLAPNLSGVAGQNPVITATAGSGGKIVPDGVVKVRSNTSQTFGIIADSGKNVSSILVDGKAAPAATSYTFSSVTGDHTIRAEFA